MNKKRILLASSGTKEGILKMIGKFYYSNPENFTVNEDGSITNTKLGKVAEGVTVRQVKGRYRFESI